ncbi:hypothetical protein CsatB_004948 [Cannabis sativa]
MTRLAHSVERRRSRLTTFSSIAILPTTSGDYASYLFPPVLLVATPIWTPPPEDWIKINCDVKVGGDSMCIVALARDLSGAVVWAATSFLNFSDPLIGEAAACHLALDTTRLRNHDYVLVESDSDVVIKVLKGLHYIWNIDNYVSLCNQLSNYFLSYNFSFISRVCNFAAHNVARWAFAQNFTDVMESSCIPVSILCNDREV